MTLDSLNAFTVTVALQSVLWKYSCVSQVETSAYFFVLIISYPLALIK